jgi:hypothetical protein
MAVRARGDRMPASKPAPRQAKVEQDHTRTGTLDRIGKLPALEEIIQRNLPIEEVAHFVRNPVLLQGANDELSVICIIFNE